MANNLKNKKKGYVSEIIGYGKNVKEEQKDEQKAESDRQKYRLGTVRLTIILCFVGIGMLIVLMFLDLFCQKTITSSPLFIALTGILGSVLATAVGAIVGSSIH